MDSRKRSERIHLKIVRQLLDAAPYGMQRSELIEAVSHNDYRRGRIELDRLHANRPVLINRNRIDGRYHIYVVKRPGQPNPTPQSLLDGSYWAWTPEPEPASFWNVEFDAVTETLDATENFWSVTYSGDGVGTMNVPEPVSAGSFWA